MRKIILLVFALTQLGFYVLNTAAQAETSKQTKTIQRLTFTNSTTKHSRASLLLLKI